MIAGLPGVGLAGLFFLLNALMMPIVQVWRTVRGRADSRAWRPVLIQFTLAAGIVGSVALAFWSLGHSIDSPAGAAAPGGDVVVGGAGVEFPLQPIVLGLLIITGIVVAAWAQAWLARLFEAAPSGGHPSRRSDRWLVFVVAPAGPSAPGSGQADPHR